MNLKDLLKKKKRKEIVVACADDENTLKAIEEARKLGVKVILILKKKSVEILKKLNIDEKKYILYFEEDKKKACKLACELARNKALMKGLVDTSIFLKAILNSDLPKGNIISHVGVFQIPNYHKLIFLTDGAVNISPNLSQKKLIIKNALKVTRAFGIINPKVACICAKEKINPKMIHTLEAQKLNEMYKKGILKNCIVSGPLALDNALSKESARYKSIESEVAGDADILLMPNIETGNVLYKSLTLFANSIVAGVLVGSIPIVITSRSDKFETKLLSILLAVNIL